MNKVWQSDVSNHWQTALETNSGPLSLRMYFGTPRIRNNHSRVSITAEAGIDGATLMAQFCWDHPTIHRNVESDL